MLNSLIINNHAETGGGAFFHSPGGGSIQNTRIISNTANGGGGLGLASGSIDLVGNSLRDNNAAAGGGSAVFMFGSSSNFYDNQIVGNTASYGGGGIYVGMFDGILDRNLIMNNTAGINGGGIHVFGGNTWKNNAIIGNHANGSGGAFDIQPTGPHLIHNTIAGNTSGDGTAIVIREGPILSDGDIQIINSIITGQPTGVYIISGNHSLMIDHVLWYAVTTEIDDEAGSTVIRSDEENGDPAFAQDGYHLTGSAAALDWGKDTGTTTDIDDEPRPNNAYDIGADEFWPHIYLPMIVRESGI